MAKRKRSLWLMVTKDKYELPIAVADTAPQLAQVTGCSENLIRSSATRQKNGQWKYSRFVQVEITEEDYNEIVEADAAYMSGKRMPPAGRG